MIYQPRNVNPSGISIDALLDNTFTMEIQTNNYVSAYQLLINDFDNNQIYAGEKIEIMFNPTYVMDPLKAIDEDVIIFKLNNGHSPAMIKCSIPFLYVLMPLRIN